MLEAFGFNQELERCFNISFCSESGKAVELSNKSICFLQNLLKRYSTHEILTESQIQEIFSTVKTKPWEPEDYKTLVPAITDGLSLHS